MHQLEPSIVIVLDAEGIGHGMGFLVGADRVCTCAHVVCDVLHLSHDSQKPNSNVEVKLRFDFLHQEVTATVDRWIAVHEGQSAGDMAILKLSAPLPMGANPVSRYVKCGGRERKVEAYGYPKETGLWAKAVTFHGNPHWVQLDGTSTTGARILPGYSGSPVWDTAAAGVAGMVVAYDKDASAKIAFMLPIETIVTSCGLAVQVDELDLEPNPTIDIREGIPFILPASLQKRLLDLTCCAPWPPGALHDAYALSHPMSDRVPGGDKTIPLVQRMLLSLATSVRGSDNMLPILAFVWRLVEFAKVSTSPELLTLSVILAQWFDDASGLLLKSNEIAIDDFKKRVAVETRQPPELHLVLVLSKGPPERFVIRAWRVLVRLDKDHWGDEDARQLDVEDRAYSADEMPALVSQAARPTAWRSRTR